MKLYTEIIQGTEAWFEIRKGKLTASNAQAIANAGKGLETLVYEILAEKYSTGPREVYSNPELERGHELEDMARQMYGLENGVEIEQIGFIELDPLVGFSPDGKIIGQNGGVEIKAKKDSTFFRSILEGEIDSKYLWQVQMQLYVSGWDFIDFIDYNPNFSKSLNVKRILPDPEKFEKLRIGLEVGRKKIAEIEEKYLKMAA